MADLDLFTGPEEQEIIEAIVVYKAARDRLDPIEDSNAISQLQLRIDILEQTIDDEIPSPLLCVCNDPAILPPLKCNFGHVLDRQTGYCVDGPKYIPEVSE